MLATMERFERKVGMHNQTFVLGWDSICWVLDYNGMHWCVNKYNIQRLSMIMLI